MKKLFLFSMVLLVSEVQAADYYFSPTGDDANPGTLARPWRTLDKLATVKDTLKPGDTIYFRGGNYLITDSTKANDFAWTAKGTESARITYKNYLNEKPVIVYDRRNTTGTNRIVVQPGSYSTIDGLTFRQTEGSRRLSLDVNGVSYTDQDNYFAKNVRPIFVTLNNVTIRNCVMDNFSSVGLAIKGANVLVEHNTFTNIANHIWYVQKGGAYGTYRYNTLDGSRQLPGAGVYGVQIQYVESHHNKIYGNVIKNTSAAAFVLAVGTSANDIYNNVLINSGDKNSYGSILHTLTIGTGNRFYNNTAIGKTGASVFSIGTTQLPKILIRDNIFYPSSSIGTGLTQNYSNIQNNIFYNVSGTVPTGNKIVNPLLVNPLGTTAASAALKSGSPAINTGLSSDFPRTDFYGNSRLASYDLGAIEFGAASSTRPLAPTSLQTK